MIHPSRTASMPQAGPAIADVWLFAIVLVIFLVSTMARRTRASEAYSQSRASMVGKSSVYGGAAHATFALSAESLATTATRSASLATDHSCTESVATDSESKKAINKCKSVDVMKEARTRQRNIEVLEARARQWSVDGVLETLSCGVATRGAEVMADLEIVKPSPVGFRSRDDCARKEEHARLKSGIGGNVGAQDGIPSTVSSTEADWDSLDLTEQLRILDERFQVRLKATMAPFDQAFEMAIETAAACIIAYTPAAYLIRKYKKLRGRKLAAVQERPENKTLVRVAATSPRLRRRNSDVAAAAKKVEFAF